jgi:hypothetical protein
LEYNITRQDMALIYMSPDPYHEAFEEIMDIRHFDFNHHHTAGLCLAHTDGRLIHGGMAPSTPAAKIPRWRSHLKGAWLIKIGDHTVSIIAQHNKSLHNSMLMARLPLPSSFCIQKSAKISRTTASLSSLLHSSHNTYMTK